MLGEEKDFRLVPNIHSNNCFLKIAVSEQLPSCAQSSLGRWRGHCDTGELGLGSGIQSHRAWLALDWQNKCGVSCPTDLMGSEIFNGSRNRVQKEELPQAPGLHVASASLQLPLQAGTLLFPGTCVVPGNAHHSKGKRER